MSTVPYNLINVTGPHEAVRRFCADAIRRVPVEERLISEVDWSFEKLFALHPSLESICGKPPWDSGHYVPIRERSVNWKGYDWFTLRAAVLLLDGRAQHQEE